MVSAAREDSPSYAVGRRASCKSLITGFLRSGLSFALMRDACWGKWSSGFKSWMDEWPRPRCEASSSGSAQCGLPDAPTTQTLASPQHDNVTRAVGSEVEVMLVGYRDLPSRKQVKVSFRPS